MLDLFSITLLCSLEVFLVDFWCFNRFYYVGENYLKYYLFHFLLLKSYLDWKYPWKPDDD